MKFPIKNFNINKMPKGIPKNKKVEVLTSLTTKEIVVDGEGNIVTDKKLLILNILKNKIPSLFDREPGSFSVQGLEKLVDEILNI